MVNLLFHDEPAETINFKKQQFYERLSSSIQTLKSLNIQNTLKSHTTSDRPHNSNHINHYSNPSRTLTIQNSQISEFTNDQQNVQNYISITTPTNSHKIIQSQHTRTQSTKTSQQIKKEI